MKILIPFFLFLACQEVSQNDRTTQSSKEDKLKLDGNSSSYVTTTTTTTTAQTGCSAEKHYGQPTGDSHYIGCVTDVNGHVSFSDPVGVTELGCSTFCQSVTGPCSASPQFASEAGTENVYAGCLTNVNGHMNFSNPTGLTELGCETFCASLNSSGSSAVSPFNSDGSGQRISPLSK